MGWFGTWVSEWRETYREYPVATTLTWLEMTTAVGLFGASFGTMVVGGRLSDPVAIPFLSLGVVFVVWFTVVRSPVFERLVVE